MGTPLPNPCQCTVPHGGMLCSWVSGEYLPRKTLRFRLITMWHYELITCSTTLGVHWPLAFHLDPWTAPKASCRTAPSPWWYPSARTQVRTLTKIGSEINVQWLRNTGQCALKPVWQYKWQRGGDSGHSMDSSIARVCGFRLFVHQTGRHENMLICLCKVSKRPHLNMNCTDGYKKSTTEKTVPWILWIILIISIQK